nr:hypothetical protein [Tanacetum cinerariifolium]
LKVNLLIAKIKALKDNPTPSSEFLTKYSSTSPKPFLKGTNTFHNSLPEFENFYFDLEEISSGSTTTHSDISLPEYEAFSFYDDHIEEISSGSTTTHSELSLPEYDSFIFDLSNDQFPPTDRSDFTHEEFSDKLAHIISPPEYECVYFRNLPDPGELISSLNSRIHENLSSTTRVNLPVEDDYSPLLAYVVWVFLAYLTYLVIPPHLHSFGNEDTICDPVITINRSYSFKPGLSHRCGTFKKFNTHRSHLNESSIDMLFSTLFPMDQSDESFPPSPIYNRYQSGDGYHDVPSPYTGTFMPPKPGLVFHNAPNDDVPVHTAFNVVLSPTKLDTDLSPTPRPLAPIIKD